MLATCVTSRHVVVVDFTFEPCRRPGAAVSTTAISRAVPGRCCLQSSRSGGSGRALGDRHKVQYTSVKGRLGDPGGDDGQLGDPPGDANLTRGGLDALEDRVSGDMAEQASDSGPGAAVGDAVAPGGGVIKALVNEALQQARQKDATAIDLAAGLMQDIVNQVEQETQPEGHSRQPAGEMSGRAGDRGCYEARPPSASEGAPHTAGGEDDTEGNMMGGMGQQGGVPPS